MKTWGTVRRGNKNKRRLATSAQAVAASAEEIERRVGERLVGSGNTTMMRQSTGMNGVRKGGGSGAKLDNDPELGESRVPSA